MFKDNVKWINAKWLDTMCAIDEARRQLQEVSRCGGAMDLTAVIEMGTAKTTQGVNYYEHHKIGDDS